jgi:hypothetical protein
MGFGFWVLGLYERTMVFLQDIIDIVQDTIGNA